ncbi:hypothetical protein [Varibaculum cambriense]
MGLYLEKTSLGLNHPRNKACYG